MHAATHTIPTYDDTLQCGCQFCAEGVEVRILAACACGPCQGGKRWFYCHNIDSREIGTARLPALDHTARVDPDALRDLLATLPAGTSVLAIA